MHAQNSSHILACMQFVWNMKSWKTACNHFPVHPHVLKHQIRLRAVSFVTLDVTTWVYPTLDLRLRLQPQFSLSSINYQLLLLIQLIVNHCVVRSCTEQMSLSVYHLVSFGILVILRDWGGRWRFLFSVIGDNNFSLSRNLILALLIPQYQPRTAQITCGIFANTSTILPLRLLETPLSLKLIPSKISSKSGSKGLS